MFAINDRVRSRLDPRLTGVVMAWLTRSWHSRAGLLIRWDNGWLEEVGIDEVVEERGEKNGKRF